MPDINNSGVYTQSWIKFNSVLNGVVDPSGKSKFIYMSYPSEGLSTKGDYPIIVLSPVEVEHSPLYFKIEEGPLKCNISVFATNGVDLDLVSDRVAHQMQLNNDNNSFILSGIQCMRLKSSAYGHFMRDKIHVHVREFNYEFLYGWFPSQ